MSDKEPPNPFEEIQRHLQDFLRNPNVKVGFTPPPASTPPTKKQDNLEEADSTKEALKRIRNFNLKPKEIRDYLNRFVVKQDEAKKVLSVAICDHFNHVRQCVESPELRKQDYSKQNVLLLGPTGVGKTYLMRTIAKLIGVPFVKADATKFSETGYVGSDVEDLVRDLVKAANGDVDIAQYGIVYIDEIDKIASHASQGGRDVSGRGVQINLLKMMEETDINLASPQDMMSQMQFMMDMNKGGKQKKKSINTRHVLFIVSGAFDGMADSIKKRVDKASIGFASNPTLDDDDRYDYLKFAETRDVIDYGFEPEFVGRLPVRVACESLRADDMAQILTTSEGSVLRQYVNDFKGYEIEFDITAESIIEISKRAAKEKTGARGLMTVLERIFRDYKFELPSTGIKRFEVTTHMIEDPKEALKKLILDHSHLQNDVLREDILRYLEGFKNEHGFVLELSDEALTALMSEAIDQDKTIHSICESKFSDFQHGLKIIQRNTNQRLFKLEEAAISDPDKVLSKWVVDSFKAKEERDAAAEAAAKAEKDKKDDVVDL